MEEPKQKGRKWRRRLLGLLGVALLGVVALPLWFPWVLKPVLRHFDLTYAEYQRLGYTRFALQDVAGSWSNTHLSVQELKCVLPTTYVWNHFLRRTNAVPLVELRGGALTVAAPAETAPTEPAEPTGSLHQTLNRITRIAASLDQWLPVLVLTNGSIQVASNHFTLPYATWRDARLETLVGLPPNQGQIDVAIQLNETSGLQVQATSDHYDSRVAGEFSRKDSTWNWNGNARWRTNQFELTAQIAPTGWWPAQAQIKSPQLSLPADLIHLDGYRELTAAVTLNVVSNQFALEASGRAQPQERFLRRGFSPANFTVAVQGDPDSFRVRQLDIAAPWLDANLTDTVGLTWRGELLANPALLQVAGDLGKFPGAQLAGQFAGALRVRPRGLCSPTAQFNLTVTNAQVKRFAAETLAVRGEFAAPRLKLEAGHARLADGSVLDVTGGFDFDTQEIVSGAWEFTGDLPKQFLPRLRYHELSTSGQAHGPLTNLTHRGAVRVQDYHLAPLRPLDAEMRWQGSHLKLPSVSGTVTIGDSRLDIGGAVDLSGLNARKATVTLTNASWQRGQTNLYELHKLSHAAIAWGATNSTAPQWRIALAEFDWRGAGRQLRLAADLAWPERGAVRADLTNFVIADFSDLITNALPALTLQSLALGASWSNGPVQAALAFTGSLTNRALRVMTVHGAVALTNQLAVDQFTFANDFTPALSVTGSVPVQVILSATNHWLAWQQTNPIALAGRWNHGAPDSFSLPLTDRGEIMITRPELNFRIGGTPASPEGALMLAAETIAWQTPTNNALRPGLEALRLRAALRPQQLELAEFTARLDGQPLEATAAWPLPDGAWRRLLTQGAVPDWTQARGKLELAGADVAALARYLPQVLAPEGKLSAELELQPGKKFAGRVTFTNVATRPLGQLAPVRDIAAQLQLDQQRARLTTFRGQIGGQPITAAGSVSFSRGEPLRYELNLQGTNVPLARSLDFLLRGDFDVQLRGSSNAPPTLAGDVRLHDGLYVQHASGLVWSGPRRPELRPPYFSITNRPVADWRMDLTISGARFLRVRTPVFTGLLSANLKLSGPLRQPVLTGDVAADSGRVIFPFGSLDLNQGFASFSGNDPQGPELQISAAGRNYRYDVRLDVKGPASNAGVTFAATPPLTSEQILLMLTAGELPQTDYTFSSSARAGRLATFLGRDLLSRFLGSGPNEERLIIRTGESISEEGQLTYSVEYRLTDRWSVIGEYDEYNAFNTDLKWKLFVR